MPKANLIILGLGGVGRALARQVVSGRAGFGTEVSIAGLADSSRAVKGPFSTQDIQEILNAKSSGKKLADLKPLSLRQGMSTNELIESLPHASSEQEAKTGVSIICDCTSDNTETVLLKAVKLGHRVTGANKKPFADSPQEVFDQLTEWPGSCRLESTAGACTPMVAAAQRLRGAGDPVSFFQGTMSGTLGFIFSQLSVSNPFSRVLGDAIEKGYTEPDCREDLSGMDVARKALILSRVLGVKADLSDVAVEALFPSDLKHISHDEFVSRVVGKRELDDLMMERVSRAEADNKVLRYVGFAEQDKIKVGMREVDRTSPIGQLQGTGNLIEFHTEQFSPIPLVLQGCGAGGDATASGILADVVELAQTSPATSTKR